MRTLPVNRDRRAGIPVASSLGPLAVVRDNMSEEVKIYFFKC